MSSDFRVRTRVLGIGYILLFKEKIPEGPNKKEKLLKLGLGWKKEGFKEGEKDKTIQPWRLEKR